MKTSLDMKTSKHSRTMAFMTVLRIQYNFSIVLHIRLKTWRTNILLGKMYAPEKLCASERFWNRELGSSTPSVQAC